MVITVPYAKIYASHHRWEDISQKNSCFLLPLLLPLLSHILLNGLGSGYCPRRPCSEVNVFFRGSESHGS